MRIITWGHLDCLSWLWSSLQVPKPKAALSCPWSLQLFLTHHECMQSHWRLDPPKFQQNNLRRPIDRKLDCFCHICPQPSKCQDRAGCIGHDERMHYKEIEMLGVISWKQYGVYINDSKKPFNTYKIPKAWMTCHQDRRTNAIKQDC